MHGAPCVIFSGPRGSSCHAYTPPASYLPLKLATCPGLPCFACPWTLISRQSDLASVLNPCHMTGHCYASSMTVDEPPCLVVFSATHHPCRLASSYGIALHLRQATQDKCAKLNEKVDRSTQSIPVKMGQKILAQRSCKMHKDTQSVCQT